MLRAFIVILFVIYGCRCYAQTLVIAHRGASAYANENSLSAFELAIKMGADYIETDLHQTKDGMVVIMHDLSLNRTCSIPETKSGKLLIKEMEMSEFSKLTFKNSSEHPPTLDSAIKLINGRCKLLIELKKGSDYYPDIEKNILRIVKENNAESWVNVIHSFDKKALLKVHEQNTGVKLQRLIVFKLPLGSFNFSKKLNRDKFDTWQGVNIHYRFASRRTIKELHKQGKTVYVWTVNKKQAAKRMIKRGVDGIITNKPDMVKALINRS